MSSGPTHQSDLFLVQADDVTRRGSCVPRPCQNGRETAVASGHSRTTRTASDLGMGWLTYLTIECGSNHCAVSADPVNVRGQRTSCPGRPVVVRVGSSHRSGHSIWDHSATHERPSNQVSNNRHGQRRTPADVDRRSFPGQARNSVGSRRSALASGRRGQRSGSRSLSQRNPCLSAALPNLAIFDQGGALRAPLARRAAGSGLGAPPAARRATPRRHAGQTGSHVTHAEYSG